MGKRFVRGLALWALAGLGTLTWGAGAEATIAVDACTTLTTSGATYTLTTDLFSCGTCLTVGANRITVDLAGHAIIGSCGDGAGIGDAGTPRDATTIRNGAVSGFDIGIDLWSSSRNTIRNLALSDNFEGIRVGARSLVQGCVITVVGDVGIEIGDHGQVEGCRVDGDGHGLNAILGGDQMLITRNTVGAMTSSAIVVGDFSTVSFNTSAGNSGSGILVGTTW